VLDAPLPGQWKRTCSRMGLLAFAAEEDGTLLGFTLAETGPKSVHFLDLEGDAGTCRLLLDRLVRAAGERDVSGWVPAARHDLRGLVVRLGFAVQAADDFRGRPCRLYYWDRNG